jgi:hypothetical protein
MSPRLLSPLRRNNSIPGPTSGSQAWNFRKSRNFVNANIEILVQAIKQPA